MFLSRASSGFSLSSVVPFIALRGRRIHLFASPYVRESGFRNPGSFLGNFCLWNPESKALGSGIQLKESGIESTND